MSIDEYLCRCLWFKLIQSALCLNLSFGKVLLSCRQPSDRDDYRFVPCIRNQFSSITFFIYFFTDGNVPDTFKIDNNGVIAVKNSGNVNRATTPVYTLSIEVKSGDIYPVTATAEITVNGKLFILMFSNQRLYYCVYLRITNS